MTRTEHDLKELLSERSGAVPGAAPRLDSIFQEGRAIRRRRRWAGAAAAGALVAGIAVLAPFVLKGAEPQVATSVNLPEGVRLAYAELYGEDIDLQMLQPTLRSEHTSYRVNCIGDTWAFVRIGGQVDHGRCGTTDGRRSPLLGTIANSKAGATPVVEVFTRVADDVPVRMQQAGTLSSADFDALLNDDSTSVSGAGEISIHDGGVSPVSCADNICVPGAKQYTRLNKKVAITTRIDGPGRITVQCEKPNHVALIWDGAGRLAKVGSCTSGLTWNIPSLPDGAMVAVIHSQDADADLMERVSTERADVILTALGASNESTPWQVSVSQR